MNVLIRYRKARASSHARAIPERGACLWRVRDRALVFLISCLATPVIAEADKTLPVPSGQPVHLNSVLLDDNPGELWVRFRFVAPKIGSTAGQVGFDVAAVDMEHLCQTLAVPYVARHNLTPARVVISLSDRPLDFGQSAPDAMQFFEAYRLDASGCVWDGGL